MTKQEISVDAYAVLGNPVAHSLSPQIHRSFAEQTQQAITYQAIEIADNEFETVLGDLQQQGMRGANVTLPFKRQAWALCDQRSPRAEDASAVNTLIFMPDGGIAGDNTDGVGLTRDLTNNLRVLVQHQTILMLGAGGAIRGVLGPMLALSPRSVTIANRTLEKAHKLADDFVSQGKIQVSAYHDLGGQSYDLIINGTAAGLRNEIPPLPDGLIAEHSICYDMMYNTSKATAFVDWAQSQGAVQAHDGLGMLVEQAAESFLVWRGIAVKTQPIIQSLRQA